MLKKRRNSAAVEIFKRGEKIVVKSDQDKPTLEEFATKCSPEESPENIDFKSWRAENLFSMEKNSSRGHCINQFQSSIEGMKGNPYAVILSDRKSTRLNSSHVSISYAV